MIDIHSHVLWGLDDGAVTIDDSLSMLRLAAESGTTDIVATPHCNSQFEYIPDRIAERIAELAARTGGKPALHRGCDLHLSFDNIIEVLDQPQRYSIDGHQYLLVECSDFQIGPSIDAVLRRLLKADLIPIVTHPERNPVLQRKPERLEAWVEEGCLVQVTALSVLGGFGRSARQAAHRLLSAGLVHVIASDAHDPVHRHPKLDEAFTAVSRDYGSDAADLLFTDNPGHIVRGEYLPSGRVTACHRPRKWWYFWERPET